MFLLLDNYDSFVFNVYQFLRELGAEVTVRRNDAVTTEEALALASAGLVLSPGPCTPKEAGILVPLVRAAAEAGTPTLGICLGNQAIAAAFAEDGAEAVVRAERTVHGKTSLVHHDGSGLFRDLPSPLRSARYHSLVVDEGALPGALRVPARTEEGEIMALAHESLPLHGVQFHPESIASEAGHELLANFITLAVEAREGQGGQGEGGSPGGAGGSAGRATESPS